MTCGGVQREGARQDLRHPLRCDSPETRQLETVGTGHFEPWAESRTMCTAAMPTTAGRETVRGKRPSVLWLSLKAIGKQESANQASSNKTDIPSNCQNGLCALCFLPSMEPSINRSCYCRPIAVFSTRKLAIGGVARQSRRLRSAGLCQASGPQFPLFAMQCRLLLLPYEHASSTASPSACCFGATQQLLLRTSPLFISPYW